MILDGSALHKTWMLTLTIPEYPQEMNNEDPFDFAQKRWHNLLRRSDKDGFHFHYFRVVELQRRGTPHFHLAINRFTPKATTNELREALQHLALKSGFGWRQDKTFDFQKATLGAAGVASYLSKYLVKSQDWGSLQREDGRAIRRYNRSRSWSTPRDDPNFRYSAVPHTFTDGYQPTKPSPCNCDAGILINPATQAVKWLKANRAEGRWIAPLGVFDYLNQKETQ